MSVCERLRVLGGLSGAGFAGFIGIFRMGEDLLTQVGSDERWTRVCERLREIMSVCECLRVLGGLGGAGFAGFIGIFRMGDLDQVGSDEHEVRYESTSVGREMAGVPPALVRLYERWTRDHESLRVLGGLSEAGFAGFIGIFRIGEDLLTQVGSDERWTRVCERLREIMSVCVCLDAFTRDWYGWPVWVDNEMGRISCIQTDAGCFVQSTKCSSVGVRWSGL